MKDPTPRIRVLRLDPRDHGRLRPAMVRASGELDLAVVERLQAAFDATSDAGELIVDLRGTTFLDCTALRALLEGHERARSRGACVQMLSSPAVDRVVSYLGGWRTFFGDLDNASPSALASAPRGR